MSLRQQLIATIALVLLATLGLGAMLVHWHAVEKVETEMVAAIAVGARIARNAVDDADEQVNPRRRLELIIDDFNGDRHLKASVRAADGSIPFQSRPAIDAEPAPGWLVRWLDQPSRTTAVALPKLFDQFGTLVLEADARNEIAEVWDDLKLYAKLLAVYSISGLGVTLFVLTHAMRPLRDLNIAVTRIGAGDFSTRLPEAGPTEIVRLAGGFNAMTHRLAQAESRNIQLVDQLSRVQEEERVELSRNLHDEVSPLLFSVDVDASAIKQLALAGRTDGIADKARAVQSAVQAMKSNVRAIIEQLRPVEMDPEDWRAAIGEMLEFWQLRFPDVSFQVELGDIVCPPAIGIAVRYLTNEGIGNALKHGAPQRIAVVIVERGGAIVAFVRDDGGGIRPVGGDSRGGYGLVGMRERVMRAGGRFELIEIADPRGVEVRGTFPLAGSVAVTREIDQSPGADA